MEKVNIKFHDNGTVTYQHKKILHFVPEMSVDKEMKLTVPNIPLLVSIKSITVIQLYNTSMYLILQTLSTQSNSLAYILQKTVAFMLSMGNFEPFVTITADELVFGYDDKLVSLAHQFYPKAKRPMSKMGLFLGVRNLFTYIIYF